MRKHKFNLRVVSQSRVYRVQTLPLRSSHLDIKRCAMCWNWRWAQKNISHHIAFSSYVRPIQISSKVSRQISREDWNWPDNHFSHKRFFCTILSFSNMIDFVFFPFVMHSTLNRNLKEKKIDGGLRPWTPHVLELGTLVGTG